MVIKGLDFIRLSISHPEQYEVVEGNGYIVAYVCVYGGNVACRYPYVDGELIYLTSIGNFLIDEFENQEQRMVHLNNIADAILTKINVN